MKIRRSFALVVLTCCSSLARAGVRVVDVAGGPGTFGDVASAAAAATDGDVLLVKSGTYGGFTITNKSLDLVADAGATVVVSGTVRVQNLAATRAFTMTGFEVVAIPHFAAMLVQSCAGTVRLQGCTLRGGDGVACGSSTDTWGGDALRVLQCADVAIERSTLLGGDGAEEPMGSGVGGHGLWSASSRVAVHDSVFRAGDAADWQNACSPHSGYAYGGPGGDAVGLDLMQAFFASRSTLTGGDGGDVVAGGLLAGCGGAGLWTLTTSSPALRALDTTFTRGTNGVGAAASCGSSSPVITYAATLTVFPGNARSINASRVTREQNAARVEVTGVPGDQVEIVFSERGRFVATDAKRGVDLVARRSTEPVLHAGTIPASGALTLGWNVPDLGPGVASRRLFAQATCVDPVTGEPTLTGVATMVLVDAAY